MAIVKYTEQELAEVIVQLPNWVLKNEKLYRKLSFDNFVGAFGFMASVALIAEKMDHHPEWYNVYGTVEVYLTTHDALGVSERDLRLAQAIDAMA